MEELPPAYQDVKDNDHESKADSVSINSPAQAADVYQSPDRTTAKASQSTPVDTPVETSEVTLESLNKRIDNLEARKATTPRLKWPELMTESQKIVNDVKVLCRAEYPDIDPDNPNKGDCCFTILISCCCCLLCCCDDDTQKKAKMKKVLKRSDNLHTELSNWKLEYRENSGGGICVAYNEDTGISEWREYFHGGICGVYNPNTKEIEWKEKLHGDVSGVYNPNTNQIEWDEKRGGGICGVYNPIKKEVEWKDYSYGGVCGVWNPTKGEIEWKEEFHGGVCGYFDDDKNCVVWKEEWQGGCAVIYYDKENNTFRTSKGYYEDHDD